MNQSTAATSRREILGGIRAVALEHLHLEDAQALELGEQQLSQVRLVEDLGLDSIQLLTLAVEVENHFKVALDEFDPEEAIADGVEPEPVIGTVGDLVELIYGKLLGPVGSEAV